jgi:hypothetical protein
VFLFGILGLTAFTPLAVVAMILGHKAKAEVAANPQAYAPSSNLDVGYILGIVGTVVLGLSLVSMIAFLFLFFSILPHGYYFP